MGEDDMALSVMLSSVRSGLADIRDAVAPVLTILKYQVIRFETVTKTPVPPRATCVAMVESSDIYLLILGEAYGDPMPGTNLAPTEEEWRVARSLGKPTVVFKKSDMAPESRQKDFIKRVEDYETGVWRHTFSDAGDFISQLEGALKSASEALQPVESKALVSPVVVPWIESPRGVYVAGGTVLETHIIPIEPTSRIRASSFEDLKRSVTMAAQDIGLFALGQALEFETSEESISVRARPDRGQSQAGVRVMRDGTVTVWESLPTTQLGMSTLDQSQFRQRLVRDMRLAGALNVVGSGQCAIGVGLRGTSMLGIPSNGGMSLPFATGNREDVHLEPTDTWPVRALITGGDDIASELSARLMLRLQVR